MAGISTIEWTDATWNPVTGCSMASPGCTNCYAMRMAARLEAMGQHSYEGLTRKSAGRSVWTGRVRLVEDALGVPLKWRTPRLVFVNSMSDLFQEDVPVEFIARVWEVMEATPRHRYQILTKRPERMAAVANSPGFKRLPNVWLGTSVEGGAYNERIDHLRSVRAAIRFISFEPLIGRIGQVNLTGIDWAIVGGESGPGARPMLVDWVDEIKAACDDAGTAFFFKQWGGVNKKKAGRQYRGQTWDALPKQYVLAG
ncbi:DUF5131 family protein [Jiella sp. M17.18]|uniref:DUF5131 family protein n=1 Tax=Jiella sp. M17.18 TaxID=3234247 RepID=UPI0034DF7606